MNVAALENDVLRAAAADDLAWFHRLAEQMPGGLERCQEIVRTRGDRVRPGSGMTLRTTPTRSPRAASAPRQATKRRRLAPKPLGPAMDPIRSRAGGPCVDIKIHPKAVDSMRRSATWRTGLDGLEVGGWLAGTWDGRVLHITDASEDTEKREANSARLGDRGRHHFELLDGWRKGFPWIGLWHVHPSGDPRPSDTDFGAWEAGLEAVRSQSELQPYYAGLIVTIRDQDGNIARPRFHGFATRQDGRQLITEPARVIA